MSKLIIAAAVAAAAISFAISRAIHPDRAMAQDVRHASRGVVAISGDQPELVPQSASFLATTTDLKQEYELIDVVRHYEQFGTGDDALEGALAAGWTAFLAKGRGAGATAVVGVRLEIANPTRNPTQRGHLLIYGTAVRVK